MSQALALLRDLFFRSKLDAAAASAGAEIVYAASLEIARSNLQAAKPAMVFVDLADRAFPAAETARVLREAAPGARLVGFASHVDLKALAAAREAGFELTLSRQEFSARLAELLRSLVE